MLVCQAYSHSIRNLSYKSTLSVINFILVMGFHLSHKWNVRSLIFTFLRKALFLMNIFLYYSCKQSMFALYAFRKLPINCSVGNIGRFFNHDKKRGLVVLFKKISTCNFTCEKHIEWNWNIFSYETANSHVKRPGSKFHMWNFGVRNMYLTCEMEDSHMKFSFHMWNWNNSHMKCYFLTWNCMWNFCKGLYSVYCIYHPTSM